MTNDARNNGLSAADIRRAERKLARTQAKNPLRRVFLTCHGWVRDPLAQVGDWLWCDECADNRRVTEVAE